jgi:hypothetical protein
VWTLFLLAGLLTAQPQQGGRGAAEGVSTIIRRADLLELTLASPVQLPNGRRVGASVRPAAVAEPWWVYSRGNLCQSVITHGPAPADATEGWKVTVTERSRTATQVIVGVTWLRMWERGRLVANGSGGTSELTLQRGDRIALDTITRASEPGACEGTTKSLEILVGALSFSSPAPAGESPLDGIVDAELWMVHFAPNGAETVEHQRVRLVNGVIGFAFKGGPIETADGVVAIELSGQLKAVRRDDGSRGLWASLTRGVTRQATGITSIAGPTTTTVGWLTPAEVVSLDLPPLQLVAGGRGGGGRGGVVGARVGGGAGGVISGGQATAGTVTAGGGAGGRGTSTGPNLLEGHRLSLRVRLVESPR